MVFVGNPGCMQIHAGPVQRIEVVGPWLNVLDPRFNLHLREDRIAAAWVVRKPSANGDIHALELFDSDGDCVCQIFGERRMGETERIDWRSLVTDLPSL
jgi:putative hemin transport protein